MLSDQMRKRKRGRKPEATENNTTLPTTSAENAEVAAAMNSVVKVFCYMARPIFSNPWQRKQDYATSTGFVLDGKLIITTAHGVEYYTHVSVKKTGVPKIYRAKVFVTASQCDIALLTVDDVKFWEGVSPIVFGDLADLPAIGSAVYMVGYPTNTVRVTRGLVHHIGVTAYNYDGIKSNDLLCIRTNATLREGSSGGPTFNETGVCVGMIFQSQKAEPLLCEVIPVPIIKHFIQDISKNGEYTGFPSLYFEWQKMENPVMRLSMGMKSHQTGVRITSVDRTVPELSNLKESDIILSIDGTPICNDGTVPFMQGGIPFSYLVSQKYIGDKVRIKVLRNRKKLKLKVKLGTPRKQIFGRLPRYYIVAGFVFTVESSLIELESDDEETVILSQVLVADINFGYDDTEGTVVCAFNDQALKNLKDLVTKVEECSAEYLKFDLEGGKVVVLETSAAKASTSHILSTYGIHSAMSDDLRP